MQRLSPDSPLAAMLVALAMAMLQPLSTVQAAETPDDTLVVTGAHVLDPLGERWLEGVAVVTAGGRITAIVPEAELPAALETRRLESDGLWLVPGLLDIHTHLLLHPYDEAPWDDQVLREPLELRTIRATLAARLTLEAGFTTIRDLGTEGAGFADVSLRDAVALGWIPGPNIVAVTRAIVASGCYGPSGFDPRWTIPQGAQEADGVEGVRRAVREQVAAGADWIKVYADYRRGKGMPATATYSQAELDAIADEARSAGLKVSSHATTPEGIRRSVLAGVATVEHGYGATDEVLKLMRDRDVVLCPTLAANEAAARYAGWKPGEPEPARLRDCRAMFTRALRSGVTIACGSDAGVFAHGDNGREIELMVEYGMSPADALRAATSVAARVIDRDADLGRIAAGAVADLVLVRSDPLRDPSALRNPALVLKNGRIAIDRRSEAVKMRLPEPIPHVPPSPGPDR